MSIRRFGDWEGLMHLSRTLHNNIVRATEISAARFGLTAEKIAKEHIAKQDLGWEPLSDKYKEQKIKNGQSEKTLVRTSSYFQSITSWSEKYSGYAGVKKTVTNADGEVVADIAKTMEYGTERAGKNNNVKIPARPLWQPTFREAFTVWSNKDTPIHILRKMMR